MSRNDSDWLSRANLPDLYPRTSDPFRPRPSVAPSTAPYDPASSGVVGVPITAELTSPASRPFVYQRGLNISFSVGVTAQPITPNRFECDAIVIDCPTTAANSVFFGYSEAISTVSGLEVRPGIPLTVSPDNTREQWELQRAIEYIAFLMAADRGLEPLPMFRSPRVVLNANDYCLVASATTAVSIMLFYIPEQQ
jgi:hypothetical protein